ncbi:MAG: hypothetical protein CVV27_12260 [Candidatus Melainabacteria bacterium HGW-Melainabacteria-1]|nr:MAG: hypothetical protein CVV27_12260 [Candidatus Melainabacteria bacterium HGW-Melainabacteria-1]
MSEYQYYEFRALDKPLSSSQQKSVAALSSRARVTSRSAVFVYNYSDFCGDEMQLVSKTFDVMLYISNWGSRRLLLKLPLNLIDPDQVAEYCTVASIEHRRTANGKSLLLDFNFDTEGGGWLDGEGWLEPLLPLREMLLRRDFRPLYLAWLKAAQNAWDAEEIDESTYEPPVPAGLNKLDPALEAWIEFLELDQDLLSTAAVASSEPEQVDLKAWIPRLPPAEQLDFLTRLSDDEPLLSVTLNRRLAQLTGTGPASPAAPRSVADLIEVADTLREQRHTEKQRQAVLAHQQQLASLAKREPAIWKAVEQLIEEKKPKSYDEALKQLKSLEQLANHQNKLADFRQRIDQFRQQYPNRSALLARLDNLKL